MDAIWMTRANLLISLLSADLILDDANVIK